MHQTGKRCTIFLAVAVLLSLTAGVVAAAPVTQGISPMGEVKYQISGTVYYPGIKTGPVYIEAFTPVVNGTFDSLGMTTIDKPGPYTISLPQGKCWMLAWMDLDGNPEFPATGEPQGSPINRSVKYRPDTLSVTQNQDGIDITLFEIPVTNNAEFQIIDSRVARSRNDTLLHGTQPIPLEIGTSVHILNREEEGFLILDTMMVGIEGSHIADVYNKDHAAWDDDHILWTYPDRYAISPHHAMDFGWVNDVPVTGDIPFSLNRRVNSSVFSTPGYQLLTFNASFDSMNCDWIYGRISAGRNSDKSVNASFLQNTAWTDAPVESYQMDNDQEIGFNLNCRQMQAGHTYTFSVVLFVDPSQANGQPMKYKPQVFMAQGAIANHRNGIINDTAIMPVALLPAYVSHASVASYFPLNWSYTSGSEQLMVLEGVMRAATIPAANFTANRTNGYVPLAIQFNDISTGSPTTWNWSFGDGRFSSVQHPVNTFIAAGNYTVSLIITNADGSSKSVKVDYIRVSPPVKVLPGYTNPPTDPDHDGIYEDLNGNNRLDFADVVLYFNQMEWIAKNEPVSAFDLNGNSRIDFADIVKLFGEI